MQLEPIRAVLTADSAQFVHGMNRARGSLDNLSVMSGRSHRALNVLKSGMVGLATQATGTAGPVGKLAQGLLMFGGGSTLILGVAAGVGVLALAYKSLTQDTKDAEEAQKDLVKALEGVGVHAQLTAARMKLGQARGALGETDVSQKGVFGRMLDVFRSEGQRETERQAALREISAAENAVAIAVRDVAKWQKQVADETAREAAERARIASMLRVVPDSPVVAQMVGESLFQRDQARMRAQLGGSIASQEVAKVSGDYFKFAARDIFLQSGISEQVRSFGISVGRQFIMGMIEGIESMQDLLKMVLMSLLDFGIGSLLNSIIPGGGSVLGIAGQTVGPAQFSLNMSGMPAASNPMAAARDAQWQSFLRESVLVAASQGFRGGK